MSFEAAFTSHLKSSVALTNIVGTKIYYDDAPPATKPPYVVWIDISDVSYKHLLGESNLTQRSVQVNCYSFSPVEANEMADSVRMAMSGVYPVMGSGPHTVTVQDCMCVNARIASRLPQEDGSARSIRVRGVEFSIGLQQAVPLLV